MSEAVTTSTFLAEIAFAIFEQHHQFTEAELMRYVEDFYAEVPPSVRQALIVGVVTGAQQAANFNSSWRRTRPRSIRRSEQWWPTQGVPYPFGTWGYVVRAVGIH